MHPLRFVSLVLVCVYLTSIISFAASEGKPDDDDLNETASLLVELLRVDTSNPPGNEGQLAALLAPKFKALGFEVDIIQTPQAGKAHFIARLRGGNGSLKPILLAAHADVVGVEREKWSVDPFAGQIKDGSVMGRGAIDFKGGLAVFAQAVMMLAKNKVPLNRDVIFLAEADEEGGQYNTRWLAENHWDKIDCEFALNEGGWIIKNDQGRVLYVSISTADKLGVSLTLTGKGTSTHSSMPLPNNAIFTLARALTKLADYDTKPKLIASTKEFFMALSRTSAEPMRTHFRNLVESSDPKLVADADREISKNPLLHAIMRNTIAPVLLNAGFRGNVIPGSAQATINFRTIPGTDPNDLIKEVESVINDPSVEVKLGQSRTGASPAQMETIMRQMRSATPSPTNNILFESLTKNAKAVYPGAEVTAYLFQAGTDAGAWRTRGIPVYGIYPYPISAEDLTRMHGNDERVPIESLRTGTKLIYQTLISVAAAKQ